MGGFRSKTIICATVISAAVLLAAPLARAQERGPLALASASYFFVGGKIDTSVEGSPMVGHMYVEYMIPARRRHPYPIVMVHGGSQTGTNFTGTPDGREGWAQYFVRRGYAVYVVDQVARGRAAYWSPQVYGPVQPSRLNFAEQRFVAPERFKQWPQAHLHTQWPGAGKPGDPAFDQFYASQFPSIVSFPKQQEINRDALVALLDKIGPAILLTHSQSGSFNWPVADARPNLIKAMVAVEPSGPPVHDIENTGAPDWFKDAERTKVSGLADVPLAYDPPVPAGGALEFVRQDKAGQARPGALLAAEGAGAAVAEPQAHPGGDHRVGGVLSRALRSLHRGLSDPGGRAQHAHPPCRCRRARQRPHDDDREEQRRDRRRDRAVAGSPAPARSAGGALTRNRAAARPSARAYRLVCFRRGVSRTGSADSRNRSDSRDNKSGRRDGCAAARPPRALAARYGSAPACAGASWSRPRPSRRLPPPPPP